MNLLTISYRSAIERDEAGPDLEWESIADISDWVKAVVF